MSPLGEVTTLGTTLMPTGGIIKLTIPGVIVGKMGVGGGGRGVKVGIEVGKGMSVGVGVGRGGKNKKSPAYIVSFGWRQLALAIASTSAPGRA